MDPDRDPPPAGRGRIGTVVTLRGPDAVVALRRARRPRPSAATDVEPVPAGPEGPGSSASADLAALAGEINDAHRDCESATAVAALEHARRAGEMLRAGSRTGSGMASSRPGSGTTRAFGYRSVASYMTISSRWSEVEGLARTGKARA